MLYFVYPLGVYRIRRIRSGRDFSHPSGFRKGPDRRLGCHVGQGNRLWQSVPGELQPQRLRPEPVFGGDHTHYAILSQVAVWFGGGGRICRL
ncbi:MAG: Dyp-type peroxidase domain-containing protein [Anaerolineae bacterium]